MKDGDLSPCIDHGKYEEDSKSCCQAALIGEFELKGDSSFIPRIPNYLLKLPVKGINIVSFKCTPQ